MYLKISNNEICYKISQDEAQTLLSGTELNEVLELSHSNGVKYQIKLTQQGNQFDYSRNDNSYNLSINQNQLEQEINPKPSKKGLCFEKDVFSESSNQPLTICLQVDLKKIKKQV